MPTITPSAPQLQTQPPLDPLPLTDSRPPHGGGDQGRRALPQRRRAGAVRRAHKEARGPHGFLRAHPFAVVEDAGDTRQPEGMKVPRHGRHEASKTPPEVSKGNPTKSRHEREIAAGVSWLMTPYMDTSARGSGGHSPHPTLTLEMDSGSARALSDPGFVQPVPPPALGGVNL